MIFALQKREIKNESSEWVRSVLKDTEVSFLKTTVLKFAMEISRSELTKMHVFLPGDDSIFHQTSIYLLLNKGQKNQCKFIQRTLKKASEFYVEI